MIKGIVCPECKKEIPVKINLTGDAIKNKYVIIDCTGVMEGGKVPEIEIMLALNTKKIVKDMKKIQRQANKLEAYEKSVGPNYNAL